MNAKPLLLVAAAMAVALTLAFEPAEAQFLSGNICQDPGDYEPRTINVVGGGPTGLDIVRNVFIHCPDRDGTEPTGEIPLVLFFHGGNGQPGGIEDDIEPDEFSDNVHVSGPTTFGEFFAVVPEGWDLDPLDPDDGNRQWNNRTEDLLADPPARPNDVKFIDQLLDAIILEYDGTDPPEDSPPWTIDLSRIYAVGFSDGGAMVNRLGVELTDRFAAIAAVAGRLAFVYEDDLEFTPNRFLPYLTIYGDMEPTSPECAWPGFFAPYDGCEGPEGDGQCVQVSGGSILEVDATVQRWAEWNGCDFPATVIDPPIDNDGNPGSTSVIKETHSNCGRSALEVAHYVVVNGGHHWPFGDIVRDKCNPPTDEDPTQTPPNSHGWQSDDIQGMQAVLEFFDAHDRGLDDDGDSVYDLDDNCVMVENLDQRDTDGDGIGNYCDPDLDNDCAVNFLDLGAMKAVFLCDDMNDPDCADADLDGSGAVNFLDIGILKSFFLGPPGPSGLPLACNN